MINLCRRQTHHLRYQLKQSVTISMCGQVPTSPPAEACDMHLLDGASAASLNMMQLNSHNWQWRLPPCHYDAPDELSPHKVSVRYMHAKQTDRLGPIHTWQPCSGACAVAWTLSLVRQVFASLWGLFLHRKYTTTAIGHPGKIQRCGGWQAHHLPLRLQDVGWLQ